MKRSSFFEKIKTGRQIKLGGKFVPTHQDDETHSCKEVPTLWLDKLNQVLEELAIAESNSPTPAGEPGLLQSQTLKAQVETGKWAGRKDNGDRAAIFAVLLPKKDFLFVQDNIAYLIIKGVTYSTPTPEKLHTMFQKAANNTHNKFKGSKVCKAPASGKTEDHFFSQEGVHVIAGLDEAGRGAFAGPIVGAVVALKKGDSLPPVMDSKGMTEEDRLETRKSIQAATAFGIGIVEADEIDQMGIDKANRLIFMRAVADMEERNPGLKVDQFVIDGNPIKAADFELPAPFHCITQGESVSKTIAAASIIAKTERDLIMCRMAEEYPGFGFEAHKGYGTVAHQKALKVLHPCKIHRKSYAPIKALLQNLKDEDPNDFQLTPN